MKTSFNLKEKISKDGFAIVNNIYTDEEIETLLSAISNADTLKPTFRKTSDLFAIRQFLKEVPAAIDTIFKDKLVELISETFSVGFFVVESIYFDKPLPDEISWSEYMPVKHAVNNHFVQ